MDLTRRMGLLDDTAAALRMIRAELAAAEARLDESAPRVFPAELDAARMMLRPEGQARVA